jgi:protein phosphatase
MSTEALPQVRLHGLDFDVAATSAQGPRNENQDAYSVAEFARTGIVAVADGMGGERAGRVAADTALEALIAGGPIRSLDAARYAVRAADEAVARSAQTSPDDRGGMGCALALLSVTPDRDGTPGWVAAHVGDVRILSRSPDGTVRLETRDHTPAFARWEAGEIALDEIPDTPGANRLQRAVGRGGEADASWIPLRPGWSYLLVSDGITKAMRLDELGRALALESAAAACDAITRKVEERGPDDNYTAVAVRVLADGAGAAGVRADENATAPNPPARARGAQDGGGEIFNPTRAMNQPRRSPLGGIAAALAVLALGLGGFALWTALQSGSDAASRADVDRLRASVDSLRGRVILLTPDTLKAAVPLTADSAPPAAPAPAPAATRAGGRP